MEVEIIKLDNMGRGIGYLDNKIIFVENALVGEVVKVDIIKKTNKYLEGKVIEYKLVCKNRIKEKCPYAKKCGGCQLEHISYQDENIYKENKVRDIIKKYVKIPDNLVKNIVFDNQYFYRNKIVLHGDNRKIGLYKKNSNQIIEIDKCLLTNSTINKVISMIRQNNKNINNVIIKTSNDNNKIMVKIDGECNNIELLKENVDVLIYNNKLLTIKDKIITNIGSYKYYQSISSFFQVNNTLTTKLYDKIKDYIKHLRPSKTLDLYCGTGTIGIYISKYSNYVYGIDYNQSNIDDALENKILNKIDNIEFICDKVEEIVPNYNDIDCVIVDPPRKGLDKKTREFLKKTDSINNIIYVSCDIITLSRDLNDLKEIYNIKEITPFNLFPRTYHCESIAVLERK